MGKFLKISLTYKLIGIFNMPYFVPVNGDHVVSDRRIGRIAVLKKILKRCPADFSLLPKVHGLRRISVRIRISVFYLGKNNIFFDSNWIFTRFCLKYNVYLRIPQPVISFKYFMSFIRKIPYRKVLAEISRTFCINLFCFLSRLK